MLGVFTWLKRFMINTFLVYTFTFTTCICTFASTTFLNVERYPEQWFKLSFFGPDLFWFLFIPSLDPV